MERLSDMPATPETLEKLKRLALKEADDRETSAGYNGEKHDGGAGMIRAMVKFFEYGQKGVVPPEWDKYLKQLDPDWGKYQELKRKFGE